MSSIKTKQIDGDVSLGRNATLGGRVRVAGSVSVGHNLKVEGWLEAPNIKSTNKGVFKTYEDMKKAYPKPQTGWIAGVLKPEETEGAETKAEFTVYVGYGGEWCSTGKTMEFSLDDYTLKTEVQELSEDLAETNEVVEGLVPKVEELEKTVNDPVTGLVKWAKDLDNNQSEQLEMLQELRREFDAYEPRVITDEDIGRLCPIAGGGDAGGGNTGTVDVDNGRETEIRPVSG
ncbi:MAG: hypothetical protein IJ626_02780 [Muribaculaceae bacterium]|nr:hypothetical protein [Muribaculaceae bacterium]